VTEPTADVAGLPLYPITEEEITNARAFVCAAQRNELATLQAMLADKQVNVSVVRRRGNASALHMACEKGYSDMVAYLLSQGADPNLYNGRGRTSLHVAATCQAPTDILKMLLDHGANPLAQDTHEGTLALDFALERRRRGGWPNIKLLKLVTDEAKANHKPTTQSARPNYLICPFCSIEYRKDCRMQYFEERAKEEANLNSKVQWFFELNIATAMMSDPRYHKLADMQKMTKEVSESMTVYETTLNLVKQLEVPLDQVTVIDLCSGCSLTAAILGLAHPELQVIAVDRVSDYLVPHFEGNIQYVRSDIFADDFFDKMRSLIDEQHTVVVVGMHLCGLLSLRAIELTNALENAKAIFLSPCCLPRHRRNYKWYEGIEDVRNEETKYGLWVQHVADQLLSKYHVKQWREEAMMSMKRAVVTGVKIQS
jgi:hypothetical protein